MSDFKVESLEQAAHVMRRYRRLAQKRAQYEALAAAERERIESWLVRVTASVDTQLEFYEAHLSGFAMRERLAGTKTLEFPDGVVKTRVNAPGVEVDRAVFVEWAQDAKRDDLLRVSVSPDMAALKASVIVEEERVIDPLSGEVIPGVTPVSERVSVSISPDLQAIDLEGIEGEEDE